MKSRYFIVILGLLPLINPIQAEDFYAPWTKSKITNNTKYSVVITAGYTIPGCKLTTMSGVPCKEKGGTDNCDYYGGCLPRGSLKLTLKPGKTITVISDNYADAIEGQVGPGDNIGGNNLKISLPFITDPKTKKPVASNVAAITIANPPVKNYTISLVDGKNLKVD